LSIQIRYDEKELKFKTVIVSGHLKRGNKLKSTFEFVLPSARVNAKMEEAERKGIVGFSVLKYVYHEGSSLQIDYLGFSNETWNGNIEFYKSTFHRNITFNTSILSAIDDTILDSNYRASSFRGT